MPGAGATHDMVSSAHCGTGESAAPLGETTARQDLLRGIWKENPVLVQLLGLCPALAVTNSVRNGLAMGLATAFVLVNSSFFVSSFKRMIPHEARMSTFVLIIATFVTVVDIFMAAVVPDVSKALGPFVPLIVVNCMILGRQEAFASRRPVGRSVLDATGTATGFLIALLLMGGFRELLGSGSLLGVRIMPQSFEPWVIMVLPSGGFFTLGFLLLGLGWYQMRQGRADRVTRPRRWPHGVLTERKAA
jgi:electron transport complex protein RnfE